MRKLIKVAMGMVLVTGLAVSAFGQKNPRGTSQITLKGKTVSVEYGRPGLKGKTVAEWLAELPAGGFWRLGADTSTTFKTEVDLDFGGVSVPTGAYSLWMQKQADNSWKLVFNKQHGQWGTDHDAAQDLASAPLKQSNNATPVDMVTITLTKSGAGGEIMIQWGTLKATARFAAK